MQEAGAALWWIRHSALGRARGSIGDPLPDGHWRIAESCIGAAGHWGDEKQTKRCKTYLTELGENDDAVWRDGRLWVEKDDVSIVRL